MQYRRPPENDSALLQQMGHSAYQRPDFGADLCQLGRRDYAFPPSPKEERSLIFMLRRCVGLVAPSGRAEPGIAIRTQLGRLYSDGRAS